MSQPLPRRVGPALPPGSTPPPLPPDLAEALADEPDGDVLARVWDLAGNAPEPSPEQVAAWGARMRDALEAHVRDAPADAPRALPRAADRQPVRSRSGLRRAAWPIAATVLTAALLLVGLRWHGERAITVAAAPGATETHVLPDGSVVTLASGASLSYTRTFAQGEALGDAGARRALSLMGEAFFDVQHGAAPFEVTTDAATVTVLGTAFGVRAEGGRTEVALESGSVRLEAAGSSAALTMQPGAVAVAEADTVALTAARVEDALAWRVGGFAFVDQPLGRIAGDVARRYGVAVAVQPEALRARPFTLILDQPEGAEAVLSDLAEYAGLTLRRDDGGFVLTDGR